MAKLNVNRSLIAIVAASLVTLFTINSLFLVSVNSELRRIPSNFSVVTTPTLPKPELASPELSEVALQQLMSKHPTSELIAQKLTDDPRILDDADPITREAGYLYEKTLGEWLISSCEIIPNLSIREYITRATDSKCFAMLYAANVANFVPTYVSTGASKLRKYTENESVENEAVAIFYSRAGICGEHTTVGLALLKRAGYIARPLEFYFMVGTERKTHILVEVQIDRLWYPVDTTYGAFWRNPKSKEFALTTTDDVISEGKPPASYNAVLIDSRRGANELFYYITRFNFIIRGSVGKVVISTESPQGEETFDNIPNFVGDISEDGLNEGVTVTIRNPSSEKKRLVVNVQAQAITGFAPAQLCLGDVCLEIVESKKIYDFYLGKSVTLSMRSEADIAYLVLNSISWYSDE